MNRLVPNQLCRISVDRPPMQLKSMLGEAGFLVAQAFCDFFLLAVDIAWYLAWISTCSITSGSASPASTVVSLTCMLISAA